LAVLKQTAIDEGWTFEVDFNSATQYSIDQLCGLKPPENWQENATYDPCLVKTVLPPSFDWRVLEGTTPIRDQGDCGSCWAFGTVGVLECAIKIIDGVDVDLSEQWLLSCNSDDWDCDGGWWAHDYHIAKTDPCDSSGAVYESEYGYQAMATSCSCPKQHPYYLESWSYIGSGTAIPSVNAMKQAIFDNGPIAVGVYADFAFRGYSTGVFNACAEVEEDEINHAVVIVGWNDSLGTEGAWIVKNSWGEDWGQDGYMLIEYNCSNIGYGACYVTYGGSVIFSGLPRVGWLPLDVTFTPITGFDVDTWTWEFGDGEVDNVEIPTHNYDNTGIFDVKVTIVDGKEIRDRTNYNYIVVLADTLRPSPASCPPGEQVEIVISANNSAPVNYIKIPIEFTGDFAPTLDSISTVGCRTDYFENVTLIHYDPFNKRYTVKVQASTTGTLPELEPGEGPVLKVYLTIPTTCMTGHTVTMSLDGYLTYIPSYYSMYYSSNIASLASSVIVTTPPFMAGDFNANNIVDISDLVYFVNYFFGGGPEPIPLESGDVDCTGEIDIADMTFMVNYMFNSGPAPNCPQ